MTVSLVAKPAESAQAIAPGGPGLQLRFLLVAAAGTGVLFSPTKWPDVTMLLVDTLFCLFLVSAFRHHLRYLFLLHPILIWVLSSSFQMPFRELGDGNAYFQVVQSTIPWYAGDNASLENLLLSLRFKDLSLGVVPVFLVPDYLYGDPPESVFFLWQACTHVIVTSLCVLLTKHWRVMKDQYLLYLILFAVVSPSFFDLGAAPTRHFVTFASVLLFYISFVALQKGFGIGKALWFLVAVFLVIMSKAPYLIAMSLFWGYFALFEAKGSTWTWRWLQVMAVSAGAGLLLPYIADVYLSYEENAQSGVSSFGFLANIPAVSIFGKYLYALLSPFPWQKANYFIETIYGGSVLEFSMHILSSLIGLYFFARLLRYGTKLARDYPDMRPILIYGLIMSLTILRGSSGYHTYLLIFFPFFAPMFAVRKYQISWLIPVVFAVSIEVIYSIASSFA